MGRGIHRSVWPALSAFSIPANGFGPDPAGRRPGDRTESRKTPMMKTPSNGSKASVEAMAAPSPASCEFLEYEHGGGI
jgi:hypothetical protein